MKTNQNQLYQLSQMSVVVADSGDINSIKEFSPTDATTNPSLIFKAVQIPEYKYLVDDAIEYGKNQSKINTDLQLDSTSLMEYILDKLVVNFGIKILEFIPGVISTEVDARLSFDTQSTIKKARTLISLYEKSGISRDRYQNSKKSNKSNISTILII